MRTRLSEMYVILVAVAIALTLPTRAFGAAPRTIAFQGVLNGASGAHLQDGPYSTSFRLYDALTGGNLLWTETKTVTVSKGSFSTALGDAGAIPASLLFDKPYWLDVQVETEPAMTPRLALRAAPYALSLSLPFAGNATSASPNAALSITNAGDGTGVGGYSASGYGVEAISTTGNGLHAFGGYSGVIAISSNGDGVYAEGRQNGVNAISRDALGIGVNGRSDAYIGVNGNSVDGTGVSGSTMNGYGVLGQADAASAFGVYGRNSANGPSVGSYYKPGANGVGLFAGDWGWFGSAAIETDLTGPGTHIYCAENGTGVFYVFGGGAVHALSYGNLSDARYKQRIKTVKNALSKVERLRGVSFEWNPYTGRAFPKGPQIGFVAQEVRNVLPELVTTDDKGYLSVEYSNVVPVLVEAIKDQQAQIAAENRANAGLITRLSRLEQQVRSLTKGSTHRASR